MQITLILATSLLCALGQLYVPLSYNSRGRRFSSRGHLQDLFPIHCADHSIFEYHEINIISADLCVLNCLSLRFRVSLVLQIITSIYTFSSIPVKIVRLIFVVLRGLIICVDVRMTLCNLKFVCKFLNNFY